MDPIRRTVAEGEFPGELREEVSSSRSPGLLYRTRGVRIDMVPHATMITGIFDIRVPTWLTMFGRYIFKEILSHNEGSKSKCQGINPAASFRTGVSIRPDNVKARVDLRYCKIVKGGVREGSM